MKPALGLLLTGAVLALSPFAAFSAGESIVEANVRLIEPRESVPVSRIPDGVYLRSTNDPDDVIWERLPEYKVLLSDAPPVHESVMLRTAEEPAEQVVYVKLARTSERFYVRLRWRDATRDTETVLGRYRDGAAVQFAIGDEQTSYIMGTGPDEPVNIWYWRSDLDEVQSLAAGGAGSTTMLDEQPVTGDSLYHAQPGDAASEWLVVMSRPIEAVGDYQVSFDRAQVPMAFALWQGSENHRDGLKRVSQDWIMVDLSGN